LTFIVSRQKLAALPQTILIREPSISLDIPSYYADNSIIVNLASPLLNDGHLTFVGSADPPPRIASGRGKVFEAPCRSGRNG
jgi:hypothetical protein